MATQPPAPPAPPAVPPAPPSRFDLRRVLWLGLLMTVSALSAIGVVTYIGWHIGPLALTVGLVAAILPVPVLIGCFLWLDRYDPSPMWILIVCFIWGAGVATGGALIVNTQAAHLARSFGQPDDLVGVLVAPFAEELLKAALPLLLFVFYRRAFAGLIDGVVYCGISATGFAMVENVLYLGDLGFAHASREGGYAAGAAAVTVMFIGRVIFTGFAHPLFTSMTGVGLGIAARSPHRPVRVVAPLAGLLVAMMMHGSWNLMAILSVNNGLIILYGYFAVFMPIFLGMLGLLLWTRSWEGRLAERVLPAYVAAGWFSPPEVATLGTLGRRLSARRWAKRVAGDAGLTAMRGYQFSATRLALLRDSMDRGVRAGSLPAAVAEERRLLEAIDGYRRAFTGRDPLTPRAWWSDGAYQIQFPDGAVRPVAAPPLPVVPVPFALAPAGLAPVGPVPPGPPPGPPR
ncbi:MAG: PrsW family intramembrane metalloprotease [Micromonosporaceae bacterium]